MSLMGKTGMRKLAETNLAVADHLSHELVSTGKFTRKFKAPVYNEFVLESNVPVADLQAKLGRAGFLFGLDLKPYLPELGNCVLVCATEKVKAGHIEAIVKAVKEA
jgi:glycine dehydrogenase subunit 1